MGLWDISSRNAVIKAIQEYDRLGEDRFLSKYGFGKARYYFLFYRSKYYASKAIMGVAHKYQFPHLGSLSCDDFSGGEKTVKRQLEKLGFKVQVLTSK